MAAAGRKLSPLGVHHMVADRRGPDRAEGADSDMKRQVDPGDSPRGQTLNTASLKCRPAVGAATEPGREA